jgi:hypothetical protein
LQREGRSGTGCNHPSGFGCSHSPKGTERLALYSKSLIFLIQELHHEDSESARFARTLPVQVRRLAVKRVGADALPRDGYTVHLSKIVPAGAISDRFAAGCLPKEGGSVLDNFLTSSTFSDFFRKPRPTDTSPDRPFRLAPALHQAGRFPRTAKKYYCMSATIVRQGQANDFDKKSPLAKKPSHFARSPAVLHLPQRQLAHELRHCGRRGPSGNTYRYSIAYPDGNFSAGGLFHRAGLTKPDALAAVQDPENFRQPIPGHPGWP